MFVLEKLVAILATWDATYQMTLCLVAVLSAYWVVSRIVEAVETVCKLFVTLFRGWQPVAGGSVVCKCECNCGDEEDDDDDSDDD